MNENTISENRNAKIDALRVIGTLLVILAHMEIPALLLNIRTFDVVMLVWISGYSFSYSYGRKKTPYGVYLKKRISKLILPVWLLITVIFISSYIACAVLNRDQLYDVNKMMQSYIFGDGMGYIWIAKVYFLIAVVSYGLHEINTRASNHFTFLAAITVYLLLYQILVRLNVSDLFIMRQYVLYLLSYGIAALIGIRCQVNKGFLKTAMIYFAGMFAVLQFICVLQGKGFSPNDYKYPPELYYIFYGLLVGGGLYMVIPNTPNKVITWASRNSYTIYLLHILAMLGYNMTADVAKLSMLSKWYIEYPIILGVSFAGTAVINAVAGKWKDGKHHA